MKNIAKFYLFSYNCKGGFISKKINLCGMEEEHVKIFSVSIFI